MQDIVHTISLMYAWVLQLSQFVTFLTKIYKPDLSAHTKSGMIEEHTVGGLTPRELKVQLKQKRLYDTYQKVHWLVKTCPPISSSILYFYFSSQYTYEDSKLLLCSGTFVSFLAGLG